jgi:hypothetical protein
MLTSARYGIAYPDPATRLDRADVPTDIASVVAAIETSAMYGQGTLAARPVSTAGSPGIQGRIYVATDTAPNLVYYDYGTGWALVGAGMAARGPNSAIPPATAQNKGTIWISSDAGVPYGTGTAFISDGAAWQKIAPSINHSAQHQPGGADSIDWPGVVHMSGSYAARPAASAANAGVIFFATDTLGTFRSDGAAWTLIAQRPLYYTVAQFAAIPVIYDGMLVALIVDAGNGIVWHFRYNGTGGTYKWEFIGGGSLTSEVLTAEGTGSTGSYVDLSAVPSIVLPRAGDYEITYGGRISNSVAGDGGKIGLYLNAAPNNNEDVSAVSPVANNAFSVARPVVVRTLAAASAVIKHQYAAITGGTATFAYRNLAIRPIRIA